MLAAGSFGRVTRQSHRVSSDQSTPKPSDPGTTPPTPTSRANAAHRPRSRQPWAARAGRGLLTLAVGCSPRPWAAHAGRGPLTLAVGRSRRRGPLAPTWAARADVGRSHGRGPLTLAVGRLRRRRPLKLTSAACAGRAPLTPTWAARTGPRHPHPRDPWSTGLPTTSIVLSASCVRSPPWDPQAVRELHVAARAGRHIRRAGLSGAARGPLVRWPWSRRPGNHLSPRRSPAGVGNSGAERTRSPFVGCAQAPV